MRALRGHAVKSSVYSYPSRRFLSKPNKKTRIMTIHKFYDAQATMSGGGEQIPEAFLQDSVTASHKFAPIHQNTRAYFRAGAEWAYRHLSPSKPETGLRWVNASQIKPDLKKEVFFEYSYPGYETARYAGACLYSSGIYYFVSGGLSFFEDKFQYIRWLDESAPAEPAKESQRCNACNYHRYSPLHA